MFDRVDWSAVQAFLYRRPVVPTTTAIGSSTVLPVAGTPAWVALDDDDPRKSAALIVAGSRWVLEQQLDQIDWDRGALKRAAAAVAEARDWDLIGKRIRQRDSAYIERKVS